MGQPELVALATDFVLALAEGDERAHPLADELATATRAQLERTMRPCLELVELVLADRGPLAVSHALRLAKLIILAARDTEQSRAAGVP